MGKDWHPFQIIPEDVLFFRDGKPATIGADHYLRSLFPPFPSTLYGAIRTRRLLDEGVDLENLNRAAWGSLEENLRLEIGEWGGYGTLELRGPWLVRNDEVLLPAPADLGLVMKTGETVGGSGKPDPKLSYQKKKNNCDDSGQNSQKPQRFERIQYVVRYLFTKATHMPASWSHPLALATPNRQGSKRWERYLSPEHGGEPKPATGLYLVPEGVREWQRGGIPEPNQFVCPEQLWIPEVRTGVGLLQDKRVSKEGQLYTFGYIRLREKVAIGFEVRGSDLKAEGSLRLGGDGRPVRLEIGQEFPFSNPPDINGTGFLLAFITPVLSEGGAYPPGFTANELQVQENGNSLTLRGGFVRSAVLVGGWDLASRRAKPLRRAIPAGSVFGFDTNNAKQAASLLNGRNTCGFPSEYLSRQGFGLGIIGAMPKEEN